MGKHADNIDFIQANIFKHDTETKYDLIWSAGLFDYFDNPTFEKVISKAMSWLSPNGKMIIGNFSWESETRFIKEFVEWPLHYRDRKDLELLALRSGVLFPNILVEEEPLGVNLFLHLLHPDT